MRATVRVLAPALLLALTASAFADAEKTVKEQLDKLNAGAARVQPIKDEALGRIFPNHEFVAVIFPQFPVARAAPEPLKPANVYAVTKDGKLTLISDAKELVKLFQPARFANEAAQKDAVRAWLRLSQELRQD